MKINFDRVDNKTPFKCMRTDVLSPYRPAFWINSSLGWNEKSKAAADGFIFVDKEVALEFTCRFIAQQVATWPELKGQYEKFISDWPAK